MTSSHEFAIRHGYDSAGSFGEMGLSPFHDSDPRFQWWWQAVHAKYKHRDLSLSDVRRFVVGKMDKRRK